ncbi:hypothetical protein WR25_16411 [Diploscapter pachys]|uniref:Uncharacterized protein n=1 Tax=Diploscapter pachys TaxID=2018661 RepID=A0A2A2L802_9BILA|nr:hypothetical protein WR25_16411 [Diploscapter pachys]
MRITVSAIDSVVSVRVVEEVELGFFTPVCTQTSLVAFSSFALHEAGLAISSKTAADDICRESDIFFRGGFRVESDTLSELSRISQQGNGLNLFGSANFDILSASEGLLCSV